MAISYDCGCFVACILSLSQIHQITNRFYLFIRNHRRSLPNWQSWIWMQRRMCVVRNKKRLFSLENCDDHPVLPEIDTRRSDMKPVRRIIRRFGDDSGKLLNASPPIHDLWIYRFDERRLNPWLVPVCEWRVCVCIWDELMLYVTIQRCVMASIYDIHESAHSILLLGKRHLLPWTERFSLFGFDAKKYEKRKKKRSEWTSENVLASTPKLWIFGIRLLPDYWPTSCVVVVFQMTCERSVPWKLPLGVSMRPGQPENVHKSSLDSLIKWMRMRSKQASKLTAESSSCRHNN